MTTKEHLLTIVSEECGEIAHAVSKALRFGMRDKEPGQMKDNAERIMEEFYDLLATVEKCQQENILPNWSEDRIKFAKGGKQIRIGKFLEYSKNAGTLKD
ncbi:MAG TPA: hypothetical protein VM101_13530 [Flavitalea sp.]|nr:hypothetical protein [Flavitalea sp.]